MSDLLVDNKNIYNLEINFIYYFSILTKVIIVLFFVGVLQDKPEIYVKINCVIKFFLGLFLIYRFNRYRNTKITFTELDRKICYSVGIYIIVISLGDYLTNLSYEIRGGIVTYTGPIVTPIVEYVKKQWSELYY